MSFHRVIQGDVLDSLRTLADGSVHCCVTSPPYWGLRDYGMPGQIGLEPTPDAYVARMAEVFREVRRVLRNDGTLWLNIGDSYSRAPEKGGSGTPNGRNHEAMGYGAAQISKLGSSDGFVGRSDRPGSRAAAEDTKPKDLVGIPWLLAFALRDDGWYLRSDIIWSKPNPMPESVTDRPTKAHEYVFLLSKSARYWYDAEAVAETSIDPESLLGRNPRNDDKFVGQPFSDTRGGFSKIQAGTTYPTRNRRTVWTIATQPYPEAHFATYPEALVEPCIKAGTGEKGCCPTCGESWQRVVERTKYEPEVVAPGVRFVDESRMDKTRKLSGKEYNEQASSKTVGWSPTCACPAADPIPCTVLDPFLGSGTTLAVAAKLGRSGIGIELNPAYVALAEKRIGLAKNPHTWRDTSRADAASLFHQEPA